jgi:hypothetical protein
MRARMAWLVGILAISAGAVAALSLSRGQEQGPGKGQSPANAAPAASPGSAPARVNLAKLLPLHKQMYLSAQAGADWLDRAYRSEGRFLYGFVPDLNVALEGDHYLRQVGAAFALARAARYTKDERYTAKARQAVVTLLLDTTPDSGDRQVRSTALPSTLVNRLATAGLLVMAINELPSPAEDLLKQSEQLCAYIRKQQQADGSLSLGDTPEGDKKARAADPEGFNYYPGMALYGLMLSQRHKPAAWKTDLVRKAVKFYQPWWRVHKNMAMVPWHTAAYTEAHLLTREKAFADCTNEMNDWLCGLQYVQLDRRHPFWVGGFMGWADDKAAALAPDAGSAAYAESLAEACRVARQAGDLPRFQRYREAIENCLRFLTSLQYREPNTQHFADWYRPALLGGFHASHQDGNLRIDYTQHAVCALVQYLRYVVEVGG